MESLQGSILRGGGRLSGGRGGGRWQRQTGLWSNSGHQNGIQLSIRYREVVRRVTPPRA